VIVIGRFPIYLEEATRLKARAFDIPMHIWSTLTEDEQWKANEEFLAQAISAGEQIILATPPEKVPGGRTLEKELNYLASRGYLPRWIDDHWEVLKVR
jgi:hypothetical protein